MNAPSHRLMDPALPTLGKALDCEYMRQALESALFAPGREHGAGKRGRVFSCAIGHIKYKPGRCCLVCYRLEVLDAASGEHSTILVSGRAYPPGTSSSRYARASKASTVAVLLGPAVRHIEHLGLVLWVFPSDRKLHYLQSLVDEEQLRADVMPRLVAGRFGREWTIESLKPRVAHYVPEHSCTVCAQMRLRNARSGRCRNWVVFGKTYYHDGGAGIFRCMKELWRYCAPGARFAVPRPLGYDSITRTLWQEGLSGRTLLQRYPTLNVSARDRRRVAQAIASFHAAPLSGLPTVTVEGIVADLLDRGAVIAAALPSHKALIGRITERLVASAPANPTLTTLHGDLHAQNIFFVGDVVALIDLDGLERGPPLLDIGSWTAASIYRNLLDGRAVADSIRTARLFNDDYVQSMGQCCDPTSLGWYASYALIAQRCYRALSRLKPGRIEMVRDLLVAADHISADSRALVSRKFVHSQTSSSARITAESLP